MNLNTVFLFVRTVVFVGFCSLMYLQMVEMNESMKMTHESLNTIFAVNVYTAQLLTDTVFSGDEEKLTKYHDMIEKCIEQSKN